MAKEVLQQHGTLREHDRDHARDDERDRVALWPGKRSVTAEHAADPNSERTSDLARLQASLQAMESSGAALPTSIASQFAPLLGADLSNVRVHTSGPASRVAAQLGAQAFTHGEHIAFAPGQYDPESRRGRHIIAHELIHVVQNQRSGGTGMQVAARLDVGPSGSAIETEAEVGAFALAAGRSFAVSAYGSLPAISMRGQTESLPGGVDVPDASVSTPTADPNAPQATPQHADAGAPAGTPASTPNPTPAPTPAATPAQTAPSPTPTVSGGTPDGGVAGGAHAAPPAHGTGGAPSGGTPEPAPAAARPSATPAPSVTLESRVTEVLEQRADPTSRAQYARATSSVNVLRLQALQYTFTKSGIGNTLFQAFVWPSEALGDHAGQIYSNNAYRGNQPAGLNADTLQGCIEGLRGVLHIIGDISALISGWAGIIAMVSGLLALITSETIVGAIGFGAIAAAADAVATITGLIKILCDVIDMILGLVQMIILIIRARASKDPAARARFAQLLHKEAGDLAANVVSVTLQIGVMAATAGAGTALKKLAGESTTFVREFRALADPTRVFEGGLGHTVENFRFSSETAGKGVASGGRRMLNMEIEEGFVGISRLKRGANGRLTRVRETVPFTTANQMQHSRLVNLPSAMRYISAKGATQTITTTAAAQLIVVTRAPAGPTTPTDGAVAHVPDRPQGALTTVQMWPSQLDVFRTAKAPLAAAKERTEEQYNNAREQAGPALAAQVDERLRQVLERSAASQHAAGTVAADAEAGRENTDRGATQAAQGRDARTRADATNRQIDGQRSRVGGAADNMHPPPPHDGPLGWLYNNTIGRIGGAIGAVQNWIRNFVGKLAMSAAGFSREELDMAGIENDMRFSSQQDQTSHQQAQETQAQVSPLQQQVHELQREKTTDQQQAIQGMADTLSFIHSLEEAEHGLDEMIASGTTYIGAVTPIIRHELEVQVGSQAIDAAYLGPINGYADAFSASLSDTTTGPQARQAAHHVFEQMRQQFPMLDTSSGETQVGTYVQQYDSGYQALAGRARSEAARVKTMIAAFAGTTDYAGVNANAAALDTLAADFDRHVEQLADRLYAAINSVLTSYMQQIDAAIAQANAGPDDPNAQDAAETPPPAPASQPNAAPASASQPNAAPAPAPLSSNAPAPAPQPNAAPALAPQASAAPAAAHGSGAYGGGDHHAPHAATHSAAPSHATAPAAAGSSVTREMFDVRNWTAGHNTRLDWGRPDGAQHGTHFTIQSGGILASADVRPLTPDAQRHSVGFVQTMHHSTRRAIYQRPDHGVDNTWVVTRGQSLDQRTDLGTHAPWYNPPLHPRGAAAQHPGMSDNPTLVVPTMSPGNAPLHALEGDESFTTWLVAMVGTDPATIVYLGNVRWNVNWSGRFDTGLRSFSGHDAHIGHAAEAGTGGAVLSGTPANMGVDGAFTGGTPAAADPTPDGGVDPAAAHGTPEARSDHE